MTAGPGRSSRHRQHRLTALTALSVVVLMLGLSFASVPLYRAFCRATGYGGTTHVAKAAPASLGTRILTVHFDANVAAGLPWRFEAETPEMAVRTGTTETVYYRVRNLSDRPTAANALYNITPDVGGFYFNKISCFCFSEQHLGPNAVAELPVVFFLDPALDEDPTLKAIDALTLSYTFFAAKDQTPTVAATGEHDKAGATPKL